MKTELFRSVLLITAVIAVVLTASQFTLAQKMDRIERGRAMDMLKNVKNAIKKDYYNTKPSFGGVDLETRFNAAEEKLKSAETLSQAFSIIAQAVMDLNDSHTRFYPPSPPFICEYGWRMKMYGDKAFITAVKDDSDGAKRGLKVGDRVIAVNGFPATRKDLWKMIYYYQVLSPQKKMVLDVITPDGERRQIDPEANITQLKAIVNLTDSIDWNEATREGAHLASAYKHHLVDVGGAAIWKMPDFSFDPKSVAGFIDRARNKHALIFDLRGNPGGYVVTLKELAGYFFDRDIKIADLKGRKPMDPQMAKNEGDRVFKGKVVVLVDSSSASAAEMFARLMQLENRGVVLGDVSAGAVMQSRGVGFDAGVERVISYGMNLTNAEVIMSDGKSLEHVGVIPDEIILPSGADLAQRRDPVLARALELVGVKIDAAAAGKLLPEEKFIERRTHLAIRFDF